MTAPSTEGPEAPSDAELIARVRAGDLDAYGELFGRHHHAAVRMARQLVPANDADDLASDAFAKVLDALRGGGGPDISFRAYLLTTVRRVHVDRIRSGRKVTSTDDIAAYERDPEGFEDPTVSGFESGAAAKAFASLPERWQAVLWHTEVEGEKPAAIAPLLGMTANGVSALAYRAREGLRQAYLQQHLADVAGDRCRWTTERLGAYVRGGLTKRENHNVREHMDDCAKCTAVYLELVEVNSALPALLAPALLGTAGIGYLAAAGTGVKVGLAGFFITGWRKVTENSTRTAVAGGAVVVVAVAAVLAAMALTGNDTPPAAISKPPAAKPSQQPPVNPPTVKPPTVKPPTVKPPPVKPTQPEPTQTTHHTSPGHADPAGADHADLRRGPADDQRSAFRRWCPEHLRTGGPCRGGGGPGGGRQPVADHHQGPGEERQAGDHRGQLRQVARLADQWATGRLDLHQGRRRQERSLHGGQPGRPAGAADQLREPAGRIGRGPDLHPLGEGRPALRRRLRDPGRAAAHRREPAPDQRRQGRPGHPLPDPDRCPRHRSRQGHAEDLVRRVAGLADRGQPGRLEVQPGRQDLYVRPIPRSRLRCRPRSPYRRTPRRPPGRSR